MKQQTTGAGAQISLFDEIIVDNFAGGGGASTGIELAAGRPVAIAINHDPDAIRMHKANHPYTQHLQASVWDVDPIEVCAGRKVGLAWFSPDCKHFSKAKGAALVDRHIRGLAWIVLRWAGTVRPRVIILENVEEFQTWGPVRKGKPIKSKAGQTFARWKQQLTDLGYTIEHRELVAADYGAPTTRKRLVLVARCDGKPIVWPKPTHSKHGTNGTLRWRSAAEFLDWTLPCYSVFATKEEIKRAYGVNAIRPLAENTMRRVIRGVDKFTIRSGKPFIVPTGYGERKGQEPRIHDIEKPLSTVVSTIKQNVCEPMLVPITIPNTSGSVGAGADQPLHTVTTAGGQLCVTPFLAQCNHAGDGHISGAEEPLGVITARHTEGVVAPSLIQYHTEQTERVRGQGLESPIQTIDASNRYGLSSACLVEYFSTGRPLDVQEPMHTATSHDREALTLAHICKFKGQDLGQGMHAPLQTITTSAGEFAEIRTEVVRYSPEEDMRYWPQIRELLNKHCGYDLKEDEVLLLFIRGTAYFIADIGLRMLTPRELYAAMGFPPDYIIDRDYLGNEYKKTAQVARCGNAVCPPMAAAVVRANLPEWCQKKLETMAELEREIAV